MVEHEILRGRVTAYPDGKNKGLVEVSVGAYDKERDKLYARVEHSLSGVYCLPEIGDVVEVEVPGVPGYEARIVHVHRQEGDGQLDACWTRENDKKQLKTRSGHTVTLDDTKDKTAITICTAGGLELRLEDEKQTVTVKAEKADKPIFFLDMKKDEVRLAAGKKLTVECGGAAIEMDGGGNIAIKAKGKLELSGQEIALGSKGKLSAKGRQTEVSGDMTAKVSGQSQLQLTSSGVTEVKGGVIKLN